MSQQMTSLEGGTTAVAAEAIQGFAAGLKGELVTPQSADYDEVRSIWNGMIDKRPALIARCTDAEDVALCVRFARANGILTAVRGAGHNIAGNALNDGGLVIDLSNLKSIQVDPQKRRAVAQPGVTLGELDRATQAHGLAVPVGVNSTTGIAGLTLGGGYGWLSRKYGMTIDNLISAQVVTAEGEKVTASQQSHPELFWGIRGGGGNFGVVTSFEYHLHPVGPEVLAGLVIHPASQARQALEFYRDFAARASDELTVWVVLRKAPPLPFLPQEVHGTDILILAALYAGDMAEGEKELAPLRAFGKPIADVIGPHQFADFQAAFDPLLAPGARNYWKSHNFAGLSDGLMDSLLDYSGRLPSPQSEIFIGQLGGAQSRVDPSATAYWHRDAEFFMNVHTRWDQPEEDEPCISWAREFFEASAQYATGGVYVNFMPSDEANRVRQAYGGNYDRLVALKEKYDPGNFFRLSQNIRPAMTAAR